MPYGQYPPPVQPRKRSGCGTGCIIAAIIGVVLLAIGLVVGYNYVKNYDWASSMEPSCTQDYDY
jgi:hypothetical protein